LGDLLWARLDAHGWGGTRAAALEILEVDLELSTQGLLIWQAGVS
jgi:hypothetical protein